jgi:hypothetical protein
LAKEEAGEREGTPHPPVFSVRVANKGVRLDAASRLADAGFEVAGFSMICRWLVIVAGKGLREETLKVDPSTPLRAGSLKLKGEK